MKLHIKELGAIKEGTIDLSKKLNIFCGQNNTGKTYLAFVIYALTREKISRNPLKIDLASLIEKGETEILIDYKSIFDYKIDTFSEVKSNLDTVFGISEETMQMMFSKFEINLLSSDDEFAADCENLEFDEILFFGEHKFKIEKQKSEKNLLMKIVDGIDYSDLLNDRISLIRLSALLINRIAFYPITKSIIFPVERNSIFTFSKELSISRNLLIDQMHKISNGEKLDPFEMLQGGANRYPLAIRDGLNIADDLIARSNKKSEFYNFGLEIEQKLLNGSLQIEKKSGGIFFVSNRNKKVKMPIHMTASIVKTLSSVVFYLKYSAEKNDLIIIDEPEMNLHPDNQIILTRVFAKLYNRGFRLLISTHSDYIVREINNLIMANSIQSTNNESVSKLYLEDEKINQKDVGVNYFHFSKSNATQLTIKNIEVSKAGFEVDSIDKEINDQNERAMDLYYELNKES